MCVYSWSAAGGLLTEHYCGLRPYSGSLRVKGLLGTGTSLLTGSLPRPEPVSGKRAHGQWRGQQGTQAGAGVRSKQPPEEAADFLPQGRRTSRAKRSTRKFWLPGEFGVFQVPYNMSPAQQQSLAPNPG